MNWHLSLIRILPAHQRCGMPLPGHMAAVLLSAVDAGKNPAYVRIEEGQDWFESVALAGDRSM